MNKSELTLIVDGNWLLMTHLIVLMKKYATTDEIISHLPLSYLRSIQNMLYKVPNVDNVIIVADKGSWRKHIELPKAMANITYKGQRNHTGSPYDWGEMYRAYDDMLDKVRTFGVSVYQHNQVEGDDWCMWLSKKLLDDGTNCIIWSADRDLTQLVKTNRNGNFCVCWCQTSTRKKDGTMMSLFVDSTNEISLMNPKYMKNVTILNKIIDNVESVSRIDPHNVVVDKIFFGDTSDNIFPPMKIQSKTTQKRIPKKYVDLSLDSDDDECLKTMILEMRDEYKDKMIHTNGEIFEHLCYNRKLVTLDTRYYPTEIVEILSNSVDYTKYRDISSIINYYEAQQRNTTNNNFTNILETI